MQGYFRQPQETAKVLKDGWFYTGDLVRCDQHGVYSFEGRKKSVVISGGTTIYPESVTSSLLTMPGITDAVTFGVEDAIWGQRLVSCVMLHNDTDISKATIIDYCRSHLAPEKIPAEIFFLEELPRGPSGKVILKDVRRLITQVETSDTPVDDIFAIAAECFNVPVEKLSLESTPYNTEGWDSLAHLTFITRLEEHCGVSMLAEDIVQLTTLADAQAIITRLQG
jgi:long-chain acyl-CoA synthetase